MNSVSQTTEVIEFPCYFSEELELGSPFNICTLRLYVGGETTDHFFKINLPKTDSEAILSRTSSN